MKNAYIVIAVVLIIIVIGFIFTINKTEAPLENVQTGVATSTLTNGSYTLVSASSTISWKGEYLKGLSEEGTVPLESGKITISSGEIKSGEFILKMEDVQSESQNIQLLNLLKSKEFFDTDEYPTAKFVLKTATPSSEAGAKEGRYVLAGNLTIKNVTKPISFIATITQDGKYLSAASSFAINRTEWDLKYNSPTFFQDLGDKLIRDAVVLKLDLKGQKVLQ